jgi:hypothetical protein
LEPTSVLYPCATSVRLGPLEVLTSAPGDCLERNGLEWRSDKKVFVGGMEFRPIAPGAVVTFDPLNAHVFATGYRALGSLLGGELIVDEGVIDWSFQYSSSQQSAPGWAMPVKSDTIKTSTIGRLPGLSGVAGYPRQPVNGFPDYTGVTDASVSDLVGAVPSLATPNVAFELSQVGLSAIPAYTLSVPSELVQKVAGLNIEAALTLQPVERGGALGISVSGRLKLPGILQAFTGELGVFWPVNGSVRLEKLLVQIGEIDLGIVRLRDVDLQYNEALDLWAGRVAVLFGAGADALGFGGTIRIQNGELKEIGVSVQGLPINIYGVASINALGGNLRLDPFGIRATAQVGVGPFVPKVGNTAVIDGEIIIDTNELSIYGEGYVGRIMIGNLELKGIRVGDMKVAYYWDGIASISGRGELYLDDAKNWGVGVSLRGAANATDISLGGDATIALGLIRIGGSAAVSTKGVIACGLFKGLWFDDVRLGLSKEWQEPAWRLRSKDCNTKEFEVPVAPVGGSTEMGSGRNASGGTGTGSRVTVADGQKMVTFAVDGTNGPATVTGPDGTVITITGAEQSTQNDPDNPRWVVIREPGDTISYVVVGRPQGGTWTISTASGAEPSVAVSVVDAASRPLDAPTSTLKATQVGAPLTAEVETVDGEPANEAPVLEIVLVLALLCAGLGISLVVLRRRHDSA